MNHFEIEIKVLLWEEKNAKNLIDKLHQHTATKLIDQNNQLNHYFLPQWNFEKLTEKLKKHIHSDHHEKLHQVIIEGKNHSIRTRQVDGKLLFVVKASVDDTTSSNGTARIEFEEEVKNLALRELDQIMLDYWFPYQSKWSRQRKEYKYKDFNVSIDKNAGYGYVAEFEKIIPDKNQAEQVKKEIREELDNLWIEELAQDRLERMFAHYNAHRPEYYGTEKTFVIL
jgi:predicted adenylyl cyclase CyaB